MTLRFSSQDDTLTIIDYYKNNSHEHVHVRKADWIEQHATAGQFLLGVDNDEEIIASSAL